MSIVEDLGFAERFAGRGCRSRVRSRGRRRSVAPARRCSHSSRAGVARPNAKNRQLPADAVRRGAPLFDLSPRGDTRRRWTARGSQNQHGRIRLNELEPLATRLHEIKPHVSIDAARAALQKVGGWGAARLRRAGRGRAWPRHADQRWRRAALIPPAHTRACRLKRVRRSVTGAFKRLRTG